MSVCRVCASFNLIERTCYSGQNEANQNLTHNNSLWVPTRLVDTLRKRLMYKGTAFSTLEIRFAIVTLVLRRNKLCL